MVLLGPTGGYGAMSEVICLATDTDGPRGIVQPVMV